MSSSIAARVLAVIPARGGSKGIPRKNVQPIGGKPLVAWSIEAARASNRVDRVVGIDRRPGDRRCRPPLRRRGHRPAGGDQRRSPPAPSRRFYTHSTTSGRRGLRARPGCLSSGHVAPAPVRDVQAAIETLGHGRRTRCFSACPAHGFVWRLHGGRLQSLTYDHRNRPRRQDSARTSSRTARSIYLNLPSSASTTTASAARSPSTEWTSSIRSRSTTPATSSESS